MFGATMRAASGEPGEIERAIFAATGTTIAELARARLEGTRRAARVFLADLALAPAIEPAVTSLRCLRLSFRLPKGAYATTALSEFMKADIEIAAQSEGVGDE